MQRSRGFTLIELLIVVGVIGVLLGIALPTYRQYVVRANQGAAKAVLLEVVQRQEQYVMQKRTYALTLAELGVEVPEDLARNYTFSITQPGTSATNDALKNMPTFQISAVPVVGSMQEGRSTLSVNQFGLRLPLSEW